MIDKAKISVGANNNMVQGPDSDDFAHLDQSPGNLDVLLTGSGITAGMVVNEENSDSRFPNRRTVDLTGVNKGRGQGPFGNSDHPQDTLLGQAGKDELAQQSPP